MGERTLLLIRPGGAGGSSVVSEVEICLTLAVWGDALLAFHNGNQSSRFPEYISSSTTGCTI